MHNPYHKAQLLQSRGDLSRVQTRPYMCLPMFAQAGPDFPKLLSQSSGPSSAVPLLAILELNSSCLLWARFVVSQIFGFLSLLLATSSGLCSAVFLSTQVSMQASTPCPPNKLACQSLPLPHLLSSPSEPCKVRHTLFNLVFTLHFCCLYFIDQLIFTVRVSPLP